MIEINGTMLVQMLNFFVLLLILKQVLFKPLISNIQERRDYISSTEKRIKEGLSRLEISEREHSKQLDEARKRAQDILSGSLEKAEVEKQRIVGAATEETRKIFEQFKSDLDKETNITREKLEAEIESLAESISKKILATSHSGEKLSV